MSDQENAMDRREFLTGGATSLLLAGISILLLDQTEVEANAIPGSESPKFRAEVLKLIERAYRSSPDYKKMLNEIAALKPGEQTAEVCFKRRKEWGAYDIGDVQEIWMCMYKGKEGVGAVVRVIDSKGNMTKLRIPGKKVN